MKNVVMPTLVTDPEHLDGTDPLAPAFPMNSAKIVSRLTRKSMGGKLVAVLRPCEIRAFVELVKLKQGRMEEVVLVGIDCLGSYRNADYAQIAGEEKTEFTSRFYHNALSGKESVVEHAAIIVQADEVPGVAEIGAGQIGQAEDEQDDYGDQKEHDDQD